MHFRTAHWCPCSAGQGSAPRDDSVRAQRAHTSAASAVRPRSSCVRLGLNPQSILFEIVQKSCWTRKRGMVVPERVSDAGEAATRSRRWPAGRLQTTIICFFVFACMNTLFVRSQEGWRVAGPGNRIVSATMAHMRRIIRRSQTDPANEAPGGRAPSSNPALVPEPQDLVPVYECWHA